MKAICVRNNNGTMMRKAQALTLSVIGVFHKENMEESTGLVDTTIATCKTHLYHIYKVFTFYWSFRAKIRRE